MPSSGRIFTGRHTVHGTVSDLRPTGHGADGSREYHLTLDITVEGPLALAHIGNAVLQHAIAEISGYVTLKLDALALEDDRGQQADLDLRRSARFGVSRPGHGSLQPGFRPRSADEAFPTPTNKDVIQHEDRQDHPWNHRRHPR